MDETRMADTKAAIAADKAAVRAAARADVLKTIDDPNFEIHALAENLSAKIKLRVKNVDGQTWHVKVSQACEEGQDGYWEIPPGGTEPWKRCVYHRVTIKLSEDRHHVEDSVDHIMAVSTSCNYYEINGGRLVYAGPDDCL